MLLRLHTTARMVHTTAHPDDEDGGMLTLESRGKGVTVTVLTLNRGEGGQNKVGSNLFDVLGVLRTLELLGADQYYGVEQRFTRVADFGYSKTANETFQKWQGHDIALDDMVRVIRTLRPDVLVARFSGTDRDGHGHHQASSILTREAFRAAADPNRFPEQIKEGLLPWQAKKLYIGNVCGFGATSCPDENWTVKLNTGKRDSALGMSYAQFAMQGLKHQLSQGAGGWSIDPGDRFAFYKLVDSVLPSTADKNGHEQDFFDGIDTSLPGLAARLGEEEKKVPWLQPELVEIADGVRETAEQSEKDPSSAGRSLFAVVNSLRRAVTDVQSSQLHGVVRLDLESRLEEKLQQAESALNLALNVTLEASVLAPEAGTGLAPERNALMAISPGQKFEVRVTVHDGSGFNYALRAVRVSLDGIRDGVDHWGEEKEDTILPGQEHTFKFEVQLPADFPDTRPYWHRNNPEEDSLNTIANERYAGLPFPPNPFQVHASYVIAEGKVRGDISAPVLARFLDERGLERKRALAVAPVFSLALEPGEQVIPTEDGKVTTVRVGVSSNLAGAPDGTLKLELPAGWKSEPKQLHVHLAERGDTQDFEFKVLPARLKEGRAQIRAVLDAGGKKYSEGYSLVTREDLDSFYYYQPALQRVSIVDVKVPHDLKLGYIMGAGDNIPTVLRQIGMDVTLIPAEKLATENLTPYGTIVLGIRANDTQKEISENHQKLLDYVSSGGTLIMQYNTGVSDFNKDDLTPFHAQLSRARVSDEDALVQILAPEDRVFHYPNQITPRDFDGWVQERGLYFMDQWDDHFVPLLASHDPGEPEQKGGLLLAHYGKGIYIYTGYAFFRQLPAGVPGAIRLYVNLLSAGHAGGR
jgi:LmbE family N-acetylglucosaminyl deacetylase